MRLNLDLVEFDNFIVNNISIRDSLYEEFRSISNTADNIFEQSWKGVSSQSYYELFEDWGKAFMDLMSEYEDTILNLQNYRELIVTTDDDDAKSIDQGFNNV